MAIELSPKRWIVVPDTQIPFHLTTALSEISYAAKHFNVPLENMLHCGDETDQALASTFSADPDGNYSPRTELVASIEELKRWYDRFPYMKVNISNHGQRYWKRAFEAGLPSMLLKSMRELFEAPDGWKWMKRWDIDAKYPWCTMHGDQFSGPTPHITACQALAKSIVIGHHHTKAGVEYVKTHGFDVWAVANGCLIDVDSYAFAYGRDNKLQPQLGYTVVLDDGKSAQWIPIR